MKTLLISILTVALLCVFSSCTLSWGNMMKATDKLNDYTVTSNEKITLPFESSWTPAMNIVPGLPIEINYDNSNTVIEVTAKDGELILNNDMHIERLGKHCEIENLQNIYWRNVEDGSEAGLYLGRDTYVSVIVYENGNIIGCAVINIYSYPELGMVEGSFRAKLIESVSFEKINGEYQDVDRDLIQQLIDDAEENK